MLKAPVRQSRGSPKDVSKRARIKEISGAFASREKVGVLLYIGAGLVCLRCQPAFFGQQEEQSDAGLASERIALFLLAEFPFYLISGPIPIPDESDYRTEWKFL
jgi:hypothetical protein